MDNHFHLVVYYDPLDADRWSEDEVVDRWLKAFPPRFESKEDCAALNELHRRLMLEDPDRLQHARKTLGSVSMFMKYLKQPIACRANKEDGCSGHFFESRFYSGAILDENGLIAAMAYVDLNPIRARIVETIEAYADASGHVRLVQNSAQALKQAIKPLFSGLSTSRPELSFSVQDYLNILMGCQFDYVNDTPIDAKSRWFSAVASFSRRQRAYGSSESLKAFGEERGWSVMGAPMRFS